MIANLERKKSHQLVQDALEMLHNMQHRGALGADPKTGDGAGILVQIPHDFFVSECADLGFQLPEFSKYGVGMVFFPKDEMLAKQCRLLLNDYIDELDFELLGYRPVPVNNEDLGQAVLDTEPKMEQVFIKPKHELSSKELERRLLVLRKYAAHNIYKISPQSKDLYYITSFSYKTIIYKGQLTTFQLKSYFPDLSNPMFTSCLALVHSRFSTNTVPKWKLAQPFRYMAHNGEINTITGNVNWWKSKESLLESDYFSDEEMEMTQPICGGNLSDSGNFDNTLEFLVFNGFSLPHALMMMIPEAWEHDHQMADHKKAFYEYHKTIMEPWDGPASICFTDGILVGATLDRNGLRPSRYLLTDDNTLILASEAGVLNIDPSKIILKGRLQPGKLLIADLDESRIIGDEELKNVICRRLPYRDWLDEYRLILEELPAIRGESQVELDKKTLIKNQLLHGYSREDVQIVLEAMVKGGKDPIGSMGADIPLAVLSQKPQHIANYFKQLFAQVTNPPIDPIRERSVMSLFSLLGGSKNILRAKTEHAAYIHLDSPVLTNHDLAKVKFIYHKNFQSNVIKILFNPDGQKGKLKAALDHICASAEDFVRSGSNLLVLSDRSADAFHAPIPSLLAVGAVHHHLVRAGLRSRTSIIVEAGDVRETHHFATLIGYGASAINPYMAYSGIAGLKKDNAFDPSQSLDDLVDIYKKAVEKGLLKIMSKIGISTVQSYQGAQIFEILGLRNEVTEYCFKGSVSRIEGLSFDDLAREALERHHRAFPKKSLPDTPVLDEGGIFQWKQRGEAHLFTPNSIHLLQLSTQTNDYGIYKKYANAINDQSDKTITLRSLLEFRKGKSIPIEEVESVEHILKRFATGAMSFGSISHEAHSTLAIAMNRIGGKSNSGEGGEDESRFNLKENGDSECSAIKQVASGRFGVTSNYLTNAKELQIKMAQGAKPGEGGQLPGHKVNDWIGRVRNSTPGVGLISPPPHHDIYSIEDLAQLIFDLKNANRKARINVKLVSKAGVGIIASGVAKAHADAILISGHDGGTGASPLSSIRHTGLPWELGLAESHQTLVKNNLRERVVLQTDGQIRTGRDLAIATLLGAEEWGVATAALVVEGCIMMRKCHLNTCPVGIATQDEDLRKRFNGKVENVINFFTFLAQDLREYMARLGFKTVNEMVGKVEMLRFKKDRPHWKLKGLDLSPILYKETENAETGQFKAKEQDHELENVLDRTLIKAAKSALEKGQAVDQQFNIKNTDRSVGAMLSNEVSKVYGSEGLHADTIDFRFKGSAGQSFGVFGAKGLKFTVEGEANDYFGKGLSGAKLIAVPDSTAKFDASQNIIIGNVAFYGATSGEAYINGMAGERFCVRNSGVKTVIEGIGDHGCEYMTGGLVIVLGKTGKNFAAGMSGGIAYVYNPDGQFEQRVNMEMVNLDPMDDDDFQLLKKMIGNHEKHTGSKLAKRMLKGWEAYKRCFVKVMPEEYKSVLASRKKEKTNVAI
jgi:glutamate synthase (NADPH/NADH) large chain